VRNRHDSRRIASPSPPSTIGDSATKRAVAFNKATPDNTLLHTEGDQVADAVPRPQDTHRASPTLCKVRTPATTVEGKDTSVDFANSHSNPVGQKYISNPHRRRLPTPPASN